MFDSQTIQVQGTGPTYIYSPWFPRGGDYGLVTVEVVAIGGGATLAVTMVQKNSSIPGDGTVLAGVSAISLTAPGRTTKDFKAGVDSSSFAGFEELVRYKFTLTGGGGSTVTSWATFRMLPTTWYDKV